MFKLKYFKYIIISIFALLLGSCTETTNQVRPTRSQAANNVTSSNPPARGPADTLAPRTNSKEQRIALIIGNGAYQHTSELKNAVNDARSIRNELKKKGFKVQYHENASRNQMYDAIEDFIPKLSANSIGLVFYSGHGVQIDGKNYLLPVDIKVRNPRDIERDGTSLQNLLARMGKQQTKFSLAIIDACRDNPFHYANAGQTKTVSRSKGLAKSSSSKGVMVVYSAGANQTALDWLDENDDDPNGLFTREFLKVIREPGLTVQEVIQKTKKSVYAKAQKADPPHEQTPAIYDETVGSFVFTPGMRREEREIQALKARAEAAERKAKLAQQNTQADTSSIPFAPGTVHVYAAHPGDVILDPPPTGNLRNSFFTYGLLSALQGSNLNLINVLAITTREVKRIIGYVYRYNCDKCQGQAPFVLGSPDTQRYFDFNNVREPRLALVIGNSNYKNSSLYTTLYDAKDIGEKLKKLGFIVTAKTNLTQRDTYTALAAFLKQIKNTRASNISKTRGLAQMEPAGIVILFYYSGIGVRSVNNQNYLMPVDANIKSDNDIEKYCINIQTITNKLEQHTNNINILIFDASFTRLGL